MMEEKILDSLNKVQTTTKTLAERVADQLNNLIIEQNLQPGDKLPNEFELCEKLSVGRGTIREAEKILAARHILSMQQGRGTFVAEHPGRVKDPFGISYMGDKKRLVHELYDIRYVLEPWIAEQAALHRTEEDLVEIKEALDKLRVSTLKGVPSMQEDDQRFHSAIAKATQNRIIPVFLPAINYGIFAFLQDNSAVNGDESIKLHEAVYQAIKDGDPSAARKAMEDHMKLNLRSVGSLMEEE